MTDRFSPHFSAAQISQMVSTANAIGEGFARTPDRDVWIWCSAARNEIVDECCSPVTDLRSLRIELDCVDAMLTVLENRRAEVRKAMIPAGQEFRR